MQYQIVTEPKGYQNKKDVTSLPPGVLVYGSQNVTSTDSDTWAIRKGYTIDGASNSALTGIDSSYDWDTSSGIQRNLRSYDDELEFRYVNSSGTVTWTRIEDSWTDVNFNYAVWWDADESEDILLFVNGDSNIYAWSGAYAEVDITGSTSNTLKLQDSSSTWAQKRFVTNGGSMTYTKQLNINGTTYTYTGGETTNTLTGVSPDPTSGGHSDGDVGVQVVTTFSNKPASDSTTFPNDLIAVLNNQVYIGSTINNGVYISSNTDFTDFAFSSPRVPGEGAFLTLDGACVGFSPQENEMYITAGKDQWYQTIFNLSADNTAEALSIQRLKTSPQQAALSQNAIGNIKNFTVFISNEPTLDFLGSVANVNTIQANPISDPIKKDFDNYDFAGVDIKYFKNNLFIALPEESKLLVFNLEKGFWEAPWTMPAGKLAIIDNELYLHSNAVPETYKLFDGYSDNDNPINAIARFAYENYGYRANLKDATHLFSEGFIDLNTTVTRTDRYDWKGYTSEQSHEIKGNDSRWIFSKTDDGSLGKKSLGKEPLGSNEEDTDLAKFRAVKSTSKIQYYEKQVEFSSNDIDQQWEVLAYGDNATISSINNYKLKK